LAADIGLLQSSLEEIQLPEKWVSYLTASRALKINRDKCSSNLYDKLVRKQENPTNECTLTHQN